MRKFLLPIINLVNIILVSIAWGLSGKTAVLEKVNHQSTPKGNMYQIVWMNADKVNIIGIIAFFLFCVACFLTLVAFLPLKVRKFVVCLGGLMYVGSGVLFLLSPNYQSAKIYEPELTGAFIAFCVLILVAGALSLLMAAIDMFAKKESK